jgi:hypothetical protein
MDAMTSSSVGNGASSTAVAAHFEAGALAAAPALNAAEPRGPIYSLPDETLAQICYFIFESSRNDSFESQLVVVANLAQTGWKRIVPIAFGALDGQLKVSAMCLQETCASRRSARRVALLTTSSLRGYLRHLRIDTILFKDHMIHPLGADYMRSLKRELTGLETLNLVISGPTFFRWESNTDLEDWLDIFGQIITSFIFKAIRGDSDAVKTGASRFLNAMRRAHGLRSIEFRELGSYFLPADFLYNFPDIPVTTLTLDRYACTRDGFDGHGTALRAIRHLIQRCPKLHTLKCPVLCLQHLIRPPSLARLQIPLGALVALGAGDWSTAWLVVLDWLGQPL